MQIRTYGQSGRLAGLILTLLLAAVRLPSQEVRLVPVAGIAEYPDAAAPTALQFACAPDQATLARRFHKLGKPFEKGLVRAGSDGGVCHIDYDPTLPGFQADPETAPVRRLIASIDPLPFVIGRKPVGASIDILRGVLAEVRPSIEVDLLVVREFDERLWPSALARSFPDSDRRRYRIIGINSTNVFAWGQDFIRSGRVGATPRLLVPRRVFEGRGADGALSIPILDVLQGEQYVRSKLSWEGGDLLIAVQPGSDRRRILIHGGSAGEYWASESLTSKEYGYVLGREFGADLTVDLSPIGPHVDYLVSILPDGKTVLVAEPVRESYPLAKSSADELEAFYGDGAPSELAALVALLRSSPEVLRERAGDIESAIERLRPILEAHERKLGPEFEARIAAYIRSNCPQDPTQCFVGIGKQTMFEKNPALAREVADAATSGELEKALPQRLLDLIEGQLPNAPLWRNDMLDDAATTMKQLGFRVVRVPFLVSPKHIDHWVGVSYTNSLAIRGKLFVPAFGLGEAEEAIFADMARKLPTLRIVPIHARYSLLDNGGVHCILGPVRGSSDMITQLEPPSFSLPAPARSE